MLSLLLDLFLLNHGHGFASVAHKGVSFIIVSEKIATGNMNSSNFSQSIVNPNDVLWLPLGDLVNE